MKTQIKFIAIAIFALFGMQSCLYYAHNDMFMIHGTGPIVTETFELEGFTGVVSKTVIDIDIVKGDEQEVLVEGHQNMMDYIEVYVSGNSLYVDLKPGSYNNFKLKVFLTLPNIESLELESTGDITIGDFNRLENLEIDVRSTGDVVSTGWLSIIDELDIDVRSTGKVDLLVDVDQIRANIDGTGNVTLDGTCRSQIIDMASTGNYFAYNLESDICDISVKGVGDAKVNVNETLDAYITSVGNVFYKGNPSVDVIDNGIGDIIAVSN
ncbi:MAG TPA: head GIN domain-containing protein [Prolixibacteraceae bacterium]|nr:head GIN domain-containing protein [Prolixibacteraceae bacterium]